MIRALLATFIVLATFTLALPSSAQAQAQTGDDFAITLSATPLLGVPGQTLETSLRVVNRSDRARTFKIHAVSIEAEDEGRTRIVERTDDPWVAGVEVAATLDVGAMGYVDSPMKIRVPIEAPVDIHLVAVAVEPLKGKSPNEIDVQNQVINHVAVDTPGEVKRSVEVKNGKFPKIVLSDTLKGDFDVRNTGDAGVRFRGQVYINSDLDDENLAVIRTGDEAAPELLPKGRSKTMPYEWTSNKLFAVVKPTAEANFSNGAAGMQSVRSEGQAVILLPVATLIGVAAILLSVLLTIGILITKRRRTKASSTGSN